MFFRTLRRVWFSSEWVFSFIKLISSSGARFSKAPKSFRARKAIFRSSVSKNREVYTPETSCTKHILFKITQLLSYLAILDELRASCQAKHFWRQNRSLETQNGLTLFLFCQLVRFLKLKIPFSGIFNAISSEESCLISMPFLTCYLYSRTPEYFPPAES